MDNSNNHILSFEEFSFYNKTSTWQARDLMKMLEYDKWSIFKNVIQKAISICNSLQIPVYENFIEEKKKEQIKNATREIEDYNLSRFACYLIITNADINKTAVAKAQAFFYDQNLQYQIYIKSNDIERINLRGQIKLAIKSLNHLLYSSGVTNIKDYAIVNNEGIKGLYGINFSELKKRKGIPQNENFYDYLGKLELSTNILLVNTILEKIINEKVEGETQLSQLYYQTGKQVRELVISNSGKKPEDFPIEIEITNIKNDVKSISKITINKQIEKDILETKTINHFSNISIQQCKVLKNLEIKYLNRINVFAGINNSGKTTLLEAVCLLSNLNDINGFFEIQRKRGKFFGNLSSVWLDSIFQNEIIISGVFNNKKCSIKISKEQENDKNIDKSSYLNTIKIDAKFEKHSYKSKARIYQEQDSETFFERINILCNSTFSSPFSILNKEDMVRLHERSVELSIYPKIISFLQKNIDNSIIDIDLIGEAELKRFLVTHSNFEKPIDLTQFGDGIQRIFYIALQFGISQNGVLLIDELENAIHYTLLSKFTNFLQQLSEEFNVQVFITSHSKECIDAFVNNNYKIENLSFYQLDETDDGIKCKYASGETLQKLLSLSDSVDLRGEISMRGGNKG